MPFVGTESPTIYTGNSYPQEDIKFYKALQEIAEELTLQ